MTFGHAGLKLFHRKSCRLRFWRENAVDRVSHFSRSTMELPCSSSELNIEVCLLNGQSFRFKKIDLIGESPVIQGVALNRVWRFQRLDDKRIAFKVLARFGSATECDDQTVLQDYFQLNVDLLKLYEEWSLKDHNFKSQLENNFQHLTGIRILKQDPLETFFAFMCSSNNNVSRIQLMVNSLCEVYGEKIEVDVDGELQAFYNFPTLESLFTNRANMEAELKSKKFGYRAGWIVKAVEKLNGLGGRNYLETLKLQPYKEACASLMTFNGIGKKVADCICLMALNMNHVVPVDTHVFNITYRHYMSHLPNQYGKCNLKHFSQIQDFWVERFGTYAGWTQTMLFTNELRAFQQKTTKRKIK